MVMESSLMLKDQCMKDNGKKINNTVWEQKPGIKDKLDILDNFKMVKKLVEEDLSLMEATMMVISLTVNSMAKENTILLTLVKYMKENSKITTCTDKELWSGLINLDMTVNSEMEKWKDMVSNN
jgi:hypothetical protein